MKSSRWMIGVAIVAGSLAQPLAALADSKTVIESTPESYIEKRSGDDGESTYKERVDGGKIKQEYRAEDCKQDTVRDLATGNVKVVTEGDCADKK